jgi:hypothetical protein
MVCSCSFLKASIRRIRSAKCSFARTVRAIAPSNEAFTMADDQYSAKESKERFQKLVGIALKSPPKPQKKMARKGVKAQSKKRIKKRIKKAV